MTKLDAKPGGHPGSHPGNAVRSLGAVLLALLVGFLLVCLVSEEPLRAYRALLTGALPDIRWTEEGWSVRRLTRFGALIEDTVNLALLGLAVMFGFRARQFSMGADGQLFLSALAAVAVGVGMGSAWGTAPALAAAALVAMAVGFSWGWLAGALKSHFGVNEIVSTLMLNVVAIQLYRLIVTYAFNDPQAGFPVTPRLPEATVLATLLPRTNVTWLVLLVPVAALAAWFVLMRTRIGYEIRVVGDAPAFAAHAGIPSGRTVAMAMGLGGLFAGLAGLHLSHGLLRRMPVDLAPGLGFEGLMVALLGRNDPRGVVLAAFLYAYLKVGAQAMERTTDVSREMVLIIQACVVLFVVSERLLPSVGLASLRMAMARARRRLAWQRGAA